MLGALERIQVAPLRACGPKTAPFLASFRAQRDGGFENTYLGALVLFFVLLAACVSCSRNLGVLSMAALPNDVAFQSWSLTDAIQALHDSAPKFLRCDAFPILCSALLLLSKVDCDCFPLSLPTVDDIFSSTSSSGAFKAAFEATISRILDVAARLCGEDAKRAPSIDAGLRPGVQRGC